MTASDQGTPARLTAATQAACEGPRPAMPLTGRAKARLPADAPRRAVEGEMPFTTALQARAASAPKASHTAKLRAIAARRAGRARRVAAGALSAAARFPAIGTRATRGPAALAVRTNRSGVQASATAASVRSSVDTPDWARP